MAIVRLVAKNEIGVILQVLANTWQVMHDRNAMLLEFCRVTNTRQHEQLG